MLGEDGRPVQVACAAGNSNVLMAPSDQQICSGMHQLDEVQHDIMTEELTVWLEKSGQGHDQWPLL